MKEYSMGDPDSVRRKKLLFRSWHRGTREADLLLGSFAEQHLGSFNPDQLDRYEGMLEFEDSVLYDWIAKRAAPPPDLESDVLRLLLNHRYRVHPA
jgi:antitoxin CptB